MMTGVHCAVEVCSRGVLTVKVGTARVLPVNAMAFTSVLVALAITSRVDRARRASVRAVPSRP